MRLSEAASVFMLCLAKGDDDSRGQVDNFSDVDVLWAITGKAFKLGQTAASNHLANDPSNTFDLQFDLIKLRKSHTYVYTYI